MRKVRMFVLALIRGKIFLLEYCSPVKGRVVMARKAGKLILDEVKNPRSVLSVAKNLSSLTTFRRSLRLAPENDIATQSRKGEDPSRLHWLTSLAFALLCLLIQSCGPQNVSPQASESSMLVGRVLIHSKYSGRNGLLPLGVHAGHIQIEIRSEDGDRTARSTTEKDGYFFFPNLAPGTYYIRSVTFEVVNPRKEDAIRFSLYSLKTQVRPGTLVYLGTIWADVSHEGEIKLKALHEPAKARERVVQSFGPAWENREFVSTPAGPLKSPTQKLPTKRNPRR
ncbi:MAG: MSCRAMM family protein [Candidatus Binatia bacterium]